MAGERRFALGMPQKVATLFPEDRWETLASGGAITIRKKDRNGVEHVFTTHLANGVVVIEDRVGASERIYLLLFDEQHAVREIVVFKGLASDLALDLSGLELLRCGPVRLLTLVKK